MERREMRGEGVGGRGDEGGRGAISYTMGM